ncbi:hypothetical protein Nizo2484_2510 [Lactiplantibacillus plantarum]|nr:hypothetical protein Nizo2484_2510 [Lactiplantibacillus plantarum]KZU28855.1 hypothetical protein Nizo2485_0192 [Lactiplantibacillus plantarum]
MRFSACLKAAPSGIVNLFQATMIINYYWLAQMIHFQFY